MTDENRPPVDESPESPRAGHEPPPGSPPPAPLGPQYGRAPGGFASDPWDGWFGRLVMPALESKGWLRFLGVVLIAWGALSVLTIVGILFAWLYIWVGVLLWQAADRAAQAAQLREPAMLEQFLQKLKTVIIVAGVATAVSVILSIFGLIMMFAFGWAASWMEMMDI